MASNDTKNFVIAIGGTGMRCLESFVHLCAAGMFDNKEIEILTIDTDQENGNKNRVENLVQNYIRIKSEHQKEDGGRPNVNTFFSAKLNLYRFWTAYQEQSYKTLSKLTSGNPEVREENTLLSNLLLEEDTVQSFDLGHGYRAQTHLGSHLMHHSILEAARNLAAGNSDSPAEKDLGRFLDKLGAESADSRVFVFGSVFGGTGASSIPVLPNALREAYSIVVPGKSLDLDKVKFGSTLLTEYFSFKKPTAAEKSTPENSVIADSAFFALNSQAALQFYFTDPTVKKRYSRFYHIGWPSETENLDAKKEVSKVITGGSSQKNKCHVLELMCASAAYDFFNVSSATLDTESATYLMRSVPYDGAYTFSGGDFVGGESGDRLEHKMGALLAFSHIALAINKGADGSPGVKGFNQRLQQQNIVDYSTLKDDEMGQIDTFLRSFAYSIDASSQEFVPGWLYQVRHSVGSGTMMFNSSAFPTSDLDKVDIGMIMREPANQWSEKGMFGLGSPKTFDDFVKRLVDEGKPEDSQKVNTTKEKFIAHISNALLKSQKFIAQN